MMTNERNLLHSSQRQLDELLQDPNAKWNDIRNAMKACSKTACTNVALLRALTSDVGGAPSRKNSSLPDAVTSPLTATTSNENANKPEGTSCLGSQVDHMAELFDDVSRDTNNYQEYFIPTTSSQNGRYSSNTSLLSLDASVNLMDFGVDNFLGLEEESTKDDHRRRSSFLSTYTCDSDGFMGWKHGNDEMSLTSDKTSLSKVLDTEGFMAWEMSASARLAKAEAERIALELSLSSSLEALEIEVSEERRKSWKIEDYEGFNDSVRTAASTESKNLLNYLPFASRRSSIDSRKYTPATKAKANPKAELEDVKNALIKLSYSQTTPAVTDKAETKQSQAFNSKSIATVHRMLSGLSYEIDNCTQSRRRSTIFVVTNNETEPYRTTNSSPVPCSTSSEDTRQAIWINRCDGCCVDIQAECRKLYDQPKPKPQPKYHRATLFVAERPKLRRFKKDDESD